MNCKTMLKNLSKKVEKNMPTILTVAGICGFWTSGYLVYKATPKYELVRKSLYETGEPEKIEIIKSGLKVYAPAFITATLSTICLIGANSMSIHRHAALVAAYALSEANLKEFKETAEELTTSKQFEKIKDTVFYLIKNVEILFIIQEPLKIICLGNLDVSHSRIILHYILYQWKLRFYKQVRLLRQV